MLETRCPAAGDIFGIPIPCPFTATHRVTFVCDNGCEREPLDVCEGHASILRGGGPTFCAVCESHGNESRVHQVTVEQIPEASNG